MIRIIAKDNNPLNTDSPLSLKRLVSYNDILLFDISSQFSPKLKHCL